MEQPANLRVAADIRNMAAAAAKIAEELMEYAEAVATDESFAARLADEYAGPSAIVQTLQEVEHRTRKVGSDSLLRTLATVYADAQRKAGATA